MSTKVLLSLKMSEVWTASRMDPDPPRQKILWVSWFMFHSKYLISSPALSVGGSGDNNLSWYLSTLTPETGERREGEERRKLGRVLPSSLGFSSSELWQGVTQPVPCPALSAVAKLSVTLYSLTSSSSYDRLILILAKISSQIQKTQTMHFSPHLRSFNDLNFAWSNAATINKWD